MINSNKLEERKAVLDSDIQKIRTKLNEIEQQRTENVALINALTGARQQCDSFLKEINNDESEVVSDSSDIDIVEAEVVSDSSDVD
jgi:chromosome segregation ATPase|tara:strand:+ start:229 stop:486 length:258 start_codon:yes stop_codon:yes gene_type:complete